MSKGRFCTKCGKPLDADGHCSCHAPKESVGIKGMISKMVSGLLVHIGVSAPEKDKADLLESGMSIVPDVVKPNDDEIPVKQYKLARLRSRILWKYAEGKVQVTNKRVIFRATGGSLSGKIALHHEFSVNEIAGVEIKKSNRVSPLNVILSIVLTGIISLIAGSALDVIKGVSGGLAATMGYMWTVGSLLVFCLIKRKFWLKLCLLSASIEMTAGISSIASRLYGSFLSAPLFELADLLSAIVMVVWIFNIILVSLVPDLRFSIKTKGASDVVQVRRKIFRFLKQPEEYTGFSEVLPWKETDLAITELGTLIDDIQTYGDTAIEKWKE